MMKDKPTPLPNQTDDHVCEDPATLSWARTMRRLSITVLILALGSIGGGAAWVATVASAASEVRSTQTYQAQRQAEDRVVIERLDREARQSERETARALERVAVELAALRAEVRSMAQSERENVARPRGGR